MKMTKRQFLKLGLGGTAAYLLAPLLKPVTLLGSPLVTPPAYLDSAICSYWMRLSYNGGLESRRVRRTVGAALRNIGAIRGQSGGYAFALAFDEAVKAAFVRWVNTRQKPGSLFGLVGMLYSDFIQPAHGPEAGRVLFGTLLAILRGQDGTSRGVEAHQAYLTYRSLALRYKDAARISGDPSLVEQLRQERKAALENWRTTFLMLVEDYASGRMQPSLQFLVKSEMLEGFDVYVKPDQGPARLSIRRVGGQVVVDWNGDGRLQQSATPSGPWTRMREAPPAAIDAKGPGRFFRTISRRGGQK